MEENSVFCGELRASRCPGFYRLVLPALPHLRLRHRYRRTMKILLIVQQQYEVRTWVNMHNETCYKPSHRTSNKHGETRYRLNCHEERCNRKRIHTHFLKHRNYEIAGKKTELLGLYARDAQVKPHLEQQNFGESITAEHKVYDWDLWIGKQSPLRFCGAKFGSVKIRDETKLLKADMESFPGIWH